MVHAKNYENVSTFVKVMQKKTVASFFRTRCSLMLENVICDVTCRTLSWLIRLETKKV